MDIEIHTTRIHQHVNIKKNLQDLKQYLFGKQIFK